jgi:hypothetical protein
VVAYSKLMTALRLFPRRGHNPRQGFWPGARSGGKRLVDLRSRSTSLDVVFNMDSTSPGKITNQARYSVYNPGGGIEQGNAEQVVSARAVPSQGTEVVDS